MRQPGRVTRVDDEPAFARGNEPCVRRLEPRFRHCHGAKANRSGDAAESGRVPHGVVARADPARLIGMTQRATFAAGCFWGVESAFRQHPRRHRPPASATRAATPRIPPTTTSAPTRPATPRRSRSSSTRSRSPTRTLLDRLLGERTTRRQREPAGARRRQPVPLGGLLPLARAGGAGARRRRRAIQASSAACRSSTEVVPAETFFAAEDYHQQYFEKSGRTSCHAGSPRAHVLDATSFSSTTSGSRLRGSFTARRRAAAQRSRPAPRRPRPPAQARSRRCRRARRRAGRRSARGRRRRRGRDRAPDRAARPAR